MPSRTMYARESPHCANTMSPPITNAPTSVVPIPPLVRSRAASAMIASCAAITPAWIAASSALRATIVPCSSHASTTCSVASLAHCSRTTWTAMRARDLAGGVATHAVADREDPQIGVDEVRVLVVLADFTDTGLGGSDDRGATCHGSRIHGASREWLLAAHLVADVANRLDELARAPRAWRGPGARGCRPYASLPRTGSPTRARAAPGA